MMAGATGVCMPCAAGCKNCIGIEGNCVEA